MKTEHPTSETLLNELQKYIGKDINVIMAGASGAIPGKLLEIGRFWFTMETRWSKNQWFDLTKVQSFYEWDNMNEE
jgi:hypothetical protein